MNEGDEGYYAEVSRDILPTRNAFNAWCTGFHLGDKFCFLFTAKWGNSGFWVAGKPQCNKVLGSYFSSHTARGGGSVFVDPMYVMKNKIQKVRQEVRQKVRGKYVWPLFAIHGLALGAFMCESPNLEKCDSFHCLPLMIPEPDLGGDKAFLRRY